MPCMLAMLLYEQKLNHCLLSAPHMAVTVLGTSYAEQTFLKLL